MSYCCRCTCFDNSDDTWFYEKHKRQEATSRVLRNLNDHHDRLQKLRSANNELKHLINKVDQLTTHYKTEIKYDYDCSLCKKILFDSNIRKETKYKNFTKDDSDSDNYYYFDTETDSDYQPYYLTPRVFTERVKIDPKIYPLDKYPDPLDKHMDSCACCRASRRHRSQIRSRSKTRSQSRRRSLSTESIKYDMKEPWRSNPYKTNYPWTASKIEDMRSS